MSAARTSTITRLVLSGLVLAAAGCNLADPDANTDAGEWIITEDSGGAGDAGALDTGTPDTGTPDVGVPDAGSDADDADVEPDVAACPDGAARNECGGCSVLDAKIGDPCPGFDCGALTCLSEDEIGCDCLQRDGCGVNAEQTACVCQPYYEPNGTTTCADIDECAQDICFPGSTCTNLEGGFECSDCPDGTFDVNADGTRCESALEAIEVVEMSATHTGNTSECIEVMCPADKVAISGGPVADPIIEVDASRRASGGKSWLVCGFSPSPVNWDVVAVCARPNVPIQDVETIKPLGPGESTCHTTTCPDGQRAIGGGGSWGGGFSMDHNRPDLGGGGWTFCGIGGANGGDIRVTAVCADVPTTVRANQLPNNVFGSGCIQQSCDSGETLIGGGAFWGHGRTRTMNAPITPANNQWQLCGESTSRGDAWVIAICTESP